MLRRDIQYTFLHFEVGLFRSLAGRNFHPAVIFVKENGLFKVNYDGSNLTQLHAGPRWEDHALSPNGKKVLLSSALYEKSGYVVELYLMNPDGSNVQTIYTEMDSTKGIIFPQFSPDDKYVVFQTLWTVIV